MRVLMTGSAFCAALSMPCTSRNMSSGLMMSGLNLTWKDALAGQISVTPAIWLSRSAFVMDRLLKKASSDISSLHSTKRCSSPPKEYRLFIRQPPQRPPVGGEFRFQPCFEEMRVEAPGGHVGVGGQVPRAAARSSECRRLSRPASAWPQLRQARGAIRAMHDQLAEQGIVEGRHRVAFEEHGVEADAIAFAARRACRPCPDPA